MSSERANEHSPHAECCDEPVELTMTGRWVCGGCRTEVNLEHAV